MKWIIIISSFILLLILANDFWAWDMINPMLFGWIPWGAAYSIYMVIFCTLLYYFLFKFVWIDDEVAEIE